ncbi:HAMP domain-containing histidine kinase [Sphingomonas sabuli]|uniref:histidine kinase n=1 Tax=Sphingomonas sabuli TaxID=2764186 RepID=A0A7G9L2W0_9SPHN|nr:HAMP domain-containing sensor histidine kinase [Sphingomonas sabuli]QNM82959.1 HAMP domain-containing histidine kinase [Sphingomonas sabuli]
MASAPSDPPPVLGRVDAAGRLTSADAKLERLQIEAGSRLGAALALPQLANVVRLAQRLQIPVSRRVLAAGRDQDIDMWVRAVPEDGEIALSIDQWTARAAATPRLALIAPDDAETLAAQPLAWSVDEHLRVGTLAPQLADMLDVDTAAPVRSPLTRLVRLVEDDDGAMPLLDALASRTGFTAQRVTIRATGEELFLSGDVALAPDGSFAGFGGSATVPGEATPSVPGRPIIDGAIHSALRSPLDSIVRSAEDMVRQPDTDGPSDYAEYASDIASAARHLLSVIQSLGDQPGRNGGVRIDIGGLVEEAVALLETAARERSVIVGVERVDGLYARGDTRSIVQILVNLVGNALRHSPRATAVTVSFERRGGRVIVHVADKGPGIEYADQQRIFERYEKGSAAGEGSGLGLAISRRLARAMGGDIRLESTPGEGARFSLDLPAV